MSAAAVDDPTRTDPAETGSQQLRIGLVGASHIAATRVVPALAPLGWTVTGVYDREPRRLARWSEPPLRTDNLDELLASGDVDAVYISTANSEHAEQTVAAAEAGKHVLVEKPMALDRASGQRMLDAAENNHVVLAVNHHLPASPLHRTVRDLVGSGRIGQLLSARANHAVLLPEHLRGWRLSDEPGAGIVLDITVHDASVLNPLFGTEPLRATALAVSQAPWNGSGVADTVMTVIEYAPRPGTSTPLLAQTHDSFAVPYLGTSLEVHGSEGSIRVLDALTQDTAGTVLLVDAGGTQEVPVRDDEDLYVGLWRAFGEAVGGDGRPTVTGEEGLRALRVALAAAESVRTGRTVEV